MMLSRQLTMICQAGIMFVGACPILLAPTEYTNAVDQVATSPTPTPKPLRAGAPPKPPTQTILDSKFGGPLYNRTAPKCNSTTVPRRPSPPSSPGRADDPDSESRVRRLMAEHDLDSDRGPRLDGDTSST